MKPTSRNLVTIHWTNWSGVLMALLLASTSSLADRGAYSHRHPFAVKPSGATAAAPAALSATASTPPSNTAIIGGKKYRFKKIDVQIDGVNVTDTFVTRINNRGDVVGYYYDDCTTSGFCGLHGFVYSRGRFEKLDYPQDDSTTPGTRAWGINDEGTVVGEFFGSDCAAVPFETCTGHGFKWRNGIFERLPDATSAPGGKTWPYDINNHGDIVGEYSSNFGQANPEPPLDDHGFLLRQGVYTTLDAGFTDGTFATGINNQGKIVGISRDLTAFEDTNGWRYSIRTGKYTKIAYSQNGVSESVAEDINNRGTIVGVFCYGENDCHGFLSDGKDYVPFDVPFPNAIKTYDVAYGINDNNQIIGNFYDALDPSIGYPINAHGYIATRE